MTTKVTKKTRNRFREHTLRVRPLRPQTTGTPWINDGRTSQLFECREHCDWLGWVPVDEVLALLKEQIEQAKAAL